MFFLPLGTIPAHGKVIAQRGGLCFIHTNVWNIGHGFLLLFLPHKIYLFAHGKRSGRSFPRPYQINLCKWCLQPIFDHVLQPTSYPMDRGTAWIMERSTRNIFDYNNVLSELYHFAVGVYLVQKYLQFVILFLRGNNRIADICVNPHGFIGFLRLISRLWIVSNR